MHRAFCAILFFLLLLTGESMKAQTLQYFLNAARENNPAVQENRNLAAIAGLESEKAKAAYRMPEISATGNLLYAPVIFMIAPFSNLSSLHPEINVNSITANNSFFIYDI